MKEQIFLNNKVYEGVNFEEGYNLSKYMAVDEQQKVYGFTNQRDFLSWVREKGIRLPVSKMLARRPEIKEAVDKILQNRDEEEFIKKLHTDKMKFVKAHYDKVLNKIGVGRNDKEKILNLKESLNNELYGKVINTAVIFNYNNYGGAWFPLWMGFHPKLSWYHFNDRTNSILIVPGFYVILCQHSWFGGLWKHLFWSCSDLGWFRNRASSAIVL